MAAKKSAAKATAKDPKAATLPAGVKRVTEAGSALAIEGLVFDRGRMVAEAAYYRAERRGFMPGAELEDWLEAEAEIDRLTGR